MLYEKIRDVEGWLSELAANLTEIFIAHLPTIAGAHTVMEFGVHRGKYLSLLNAATAAWETRVTVVGVDGMFDGTGQHLEPRYQITAIDKIKANACLVCQDTSRLKIVVENTSNLTVESVRAIATGPLSFVSVDAGHDFKSVLHDLSIALPNLCSGGIAALDDVFNSIVPGVAEATCEYLRTHEAFAVFATGGNKVFVTTQESHAQWYAHAQGILDHRVIPNAERSCALRENQRRTRATPHFFGRPIVTFLD